jgi:hypothetical protein
MNHGTERRKREEGKIVFKSVTFIDFVYDMIGETKKNVYLCRIIEITRSFRGLLELIKNGERNK